LKCANANHYINIGTGACQATVPTGCQDPRCTGVANGHYRLDTRCLEYYTCTDGFHKAFACSGNTRYFNTNTRTCQEQVAPGCEGALLDKGKFDLKNDTLCVFLA
jgi:hypothetical protein